MNEIAARYDRIASTFSRRVREVPAGAWEKPAPCEGWMARDIVRHLVEWMPWMFFTSAGLEPPPIPSVDEDPVAAWEALDRALRAALDDPEIAQREFEMRVGTFSVERAIDAFGTDDILIHTWDLARATGLDETLDPESVSRALAAMHEVDEELLRGSGQFGPRVEVPEDADDQTKLIAYTGRRP